jgi:hypothetical protein
MLDIKGILENLCPVLDCVFDGYELWAAAQKP